MFRLAGKILVVLSLSASGIASGEDLGTILGAKSGQELAAIQGPTRHVEFLDGFSGSGSFC